MDVISEILVEVANRYLFQRAVTLFNFVRLLPNLVCHLELTSESILFFIIFKNMDGVEDRNLLHGGHLGFDLYLTTKKSKSIFNRPKSLQIY